MYAIKRRNKDTFFVGVNLGLVHFTSMETKIPFRTYENVEDLIKDFDLLDPQFEDLVICEIVDETKGSHS